jgi:hypothetical protein
MERTKGTTDLEVHLMILTCWIKDRDIKIGLDEEGKRTGHRLRRAPPPGRQRGWFQHGVQGEKGAEITVNVPRDYSSASTTRS